MTTETARTIFHHESSAPAPFSRSRRVLKAAYRLLLPNEGWVTFSLPFLVVSSVAWSIQSAKWTNTPWLPYAGLAGLITGFALAKLRIHGLFLQIAALLVGGTTILGFAVRLAGADSFLTGARETALRLHLWLGGQLKNLQVTSTACSPEYLPARPCHFASSTPHSHSRDILAWLTLCSSPPPPPSPATGERERTPLTPPRAGSLAIPSLCP